MLKLLANEYCYSCGKRTMQLFGLKCTRNLDEKYMPRFCDYLCLECGGRDFDEKIVFSKKTGVKIGIKIERFIRSVFDKEPI